MKPEKLVIISHTEHYYNTLGQIVGWGSTINEINFLATYWDNIVHVACLYNDSAPNSALPYCNTNIRFVALPPFGGKKWMSKIAILFKIPKILVTVFKAIKNATEVQLRLPTSMGLFLLPFFAFFLPRKFTFWVKYAGNWGQVNPPMSYKIQRWFVTNNFAKCNVTINGFWENQPNHCLSFENPCLNNEDICKGKIITQNKSFQAPFEFVFIGRLEEAKGISHIISALKNVELNLIRNVHFIGDGPFIDMYKSQCDFLGDKVIFYGFLDTIKIHSILQKCHFLLLPSKSEGFPKVIAEGACFGVIPVVSSVGSIPHYINASNGFVWDEKTHTNFYEILEQAIHSNPTELKLKAISVHSLSEKFTFEAYIEKLKKTVLAK
jgi:glycosyltransferase involved in cell wall biosynthesis